MTGSEIIQYIEGNYWLVTEKVALSFRSFISTGEGIPFAEIQQRRAAFEAHTQTAVFTAGKKIMPYKSSKKRNPMPNMDGYIYTDGESEEEDEPKVTPQGIAVVYIKGMLHKDSDYCTKGTTEINAELLELGASPNIKGVVLCIDSGGGQVAGTEQLADTIYNFKRNFGKRVEAVVDTAGSAAYWLASGCDKIYLSGLTSSVGSIGTMATLANVDEAMALAGIRVFNIYATLSYNKNKEYDEALAGRTELMQTDVLDKLNTVFLAAVIRGRYRNTLKAEELTIENTPEQLTGKLYFGKDAINIGLADGVATLQQALENFDARLAQAGDGRADNTQPIFMQQPVKGLTILKSINQ